MWYLAWNTSLINVGETEGAIKIAKSRETLGTQGNKMKATTKKQANTTVQYVLDTTMQTNKRKNTTQYVLDTTMRKQTQIT